MKKSISVVMLLVVFLAACQAGPAPTPDIPPTSTVEATSTPIPVTPTPSNTPVPPTPTQIPLAADYLAALQKWGFDKQFPLKTQRDLGTDKDVKVTYCAFDYYKIQNKVNFEYANLTILRVSKCYFVDAKGNNQFVTAPLLVYNRDLKKYYAQSTVGFIDGKLNPSEAYFDGLFRGIKEHLDPNAVYFLQFQFNNFGHMSKQKDWVAFFGKAVELSGEPDDSFYNEGDVSGFQDFPGAEHFIFPSYMSAGERKSSQ
jgi:hypothetical protein